LEDNWQEFLNVAAKVLKPQETYTVKTTADMELPFNHWFFLSSSGAFPSDQFPHKSFPFNNLPSEHLCKPFIPEGLPERTPK
jgi:hypothetical protein